MSSREDEHSVIIESRVRVCVCVCGVDGYDNRNSEGVLGTENIKVPSTYLGKVSRKAVPKTSFLGE